MKILFHINSMGHGGAERVVSILSAGFADNGHEVVLTTLWYSDDEYETDKRVRRVNVGLRDDESSKGRLYRIWARFAKLRKCIKNEKPDLVISFCNKANFRSAYALFGIKIPLLVSVRNDPNKDYRPYKLSTWYMGHKASGCVFQTPDAMNFFSKELKKKGRIILNPLSEQYFNRSVLSCAGGRRKEIVTVGRITEQKNQILLVKAFNEIKEKYPNHILKIYGGIEQKNIFSEMEAYINDNFLNNRVMFMGVSDRIPDDISQSALFVLPSDYEGMPNALIEAMSLGLACIATDCPCGGAAMLIEDKISGLLVPTGSVVQLADAIDYMLSHEDEAARMGAEAGKLAARVEPHKIVAKWLEFIDDILAKKH